MRRGEQPDLDGVASARTRSWRAISARCGRPVWIAEEMAAGTGRARSRTIAAARRPCAGNSRMANGDRARRGASRRVVASLSRMIRSGAASENMSFSRSWGGAAWGLSTGRGRSRAVGSSHSNGYCAGRNRRPQDLERFRVEALAAARLAHPHIVPVFQVGECDGQPYFTMQFIEGTTLARKLADGPLPAQDAARLLVPVCRAIHYAHDCGVSAPRLEAVEHPDRPRGKSLRQRLRPGQADRRRSVAHPLGGVSWARPATCRPSRPAAAASGRREPLGPAADVYSLGAILYHMLTGRPPFQAATPIETMLLALEHDPVSPRALNPRVNPDLEMVAPQVSAKAARRSVIRRQRPWPKTSSRSCAAIRSRPARRVSAPWPPGSWARLTTPRCSRTGDCSGSSIASHSSSSSALTNWLYLSGVEARWPYVLIFTVGLCGWAALFWALRRRGGPIRFVERQLAHVWGAGIVSINLIFLVEWLLDLPVLKLAPMIAVTNGMLFMIKAGILSGDYYPQAALTFLAVFPMALFPRFAPIIFGVVASACFFVTGLKYRLRRLRSSLKGPIS